MPVGTERFTRARRCASTKPRFQEDLPRRRLVVVVVVVHGYSKCERIYAGGYFWWRGHGPRILRPAQLCVRISRTLRAQNRAHLARMYFEYRARRRVAIYEAAPTSFHARMRLVGFLREEKDDGDRRARPLEILVDEIGEGAEGTISFLALERESRRYEDAAFVESAEMLG